MSIGEGTAKRGMEQPVYYRPRATQCPTPDPWRLAVLVVTLALGGQVVSSYSHSRPRTPRPLLQGCR